MKTLAFNINDHVRVKLTPTGRAELRRQFDELRQVAPSLDARLHMAPPDDADGWSRWQLWSLMGRLGHLCCLGGPEPFEVDIEIVLSEAS